MQDYQSLDSQIEYIKNVLERKTEVLPELLAEVENLQKQWKEIEQNRNLENIINDLQAELIWSKVASLEAKRDQEQEKVKASAATLQKLKNVIHETQVQVDHDKSQLIALEKRLNIAREGVAPLDVASHSLKLKIMGAKNKQRQYESEREDAKEGIRQIEQKIAETRAKIDADNQKSQSQTSELLEKRIAQVNEIKRKLTDNDRELVQIGQTLELLDAQESQMVNQMLEAESKLSRAGQDIKRLKEMIYNLKNQGSDRVSAFGPNTGNILKQIDTFAAEGKWRGSKPIGPFGRFVKLTDDRFSAVVESTLDSTLNGYFVDNDQDYHLLRKILLHYKSKAPVFKAKPNKKLDFESGRPSRDLKTILDVLNVNPQF